MKSILLHGFTGDETSWAEIRALLPAGREVWCPALLGHGSNDQSVKTFTGEVDRLAHLTAERGFTGAHFSGYSLGARVALGLAVRHPRMFSRVTLIGVNAGIEQEEERQQRARSDAEWIRMLESDGIEAFASAWEAQAIFGSQSQEQREKERARRIRMDPLELARSLRVLGLAAMPNYWPALPALPMPVHLVAGGADAKFCAIAGRMRPLIPECKLTIVPGCGHNLLVEAPSLIASLL